MLKRQEGISLIEMLLVIALGALIITASVHYFGLSGRNIRVNQAMQQVKALTEASYEWLEEQKQDDFSDQHGGSAISLSELVDAGLISDAKMQNDPWGGNIRLEPGSDPSRVKITLSGIPKQDCKNLSRRLDKISQITEPDCSSNIKNDYSGEF